MSRLAYRHQRVQLLRHLIGRRSTREDEGCFVIEGVNLLEEALKAGATLQAVYLDGEWVGKRVSRHEGAAPTGTAPGASVASTSGDRLAVLLDRCYNEGTRVFELEPGVLSRVAGTVSPQPVMAVVRSSTYQLEDVHAMGPSLVVVCVDVRDPGNAGTVARSAWAAGASGIICCGGTVDLHNPKAVRASAGAVLRMPVVHVPSASMALDTIGTWGLSRLATVPSGGEDYALVDMRKPVALVFGNEAGGLPLEELAGHIDGFVTVPMSQSAGSLNVGMAAAVLCFEVARQRRCA